MRQPRIGISGWTYPRWRGDFYPAGLPHKRELEYASRRMNSIEINGTFYALQRPTSFLAWHRETPADFVFSVKAPRFITHMLKLRNAETPLANFFASGVLALREKLGPILWQLPPGWNVNVERLEEFLAALPRGHRYAFELRNKSWMTDKVYEVLQKYDAAFCIYELAGYHSPFEITASWTYVRLHGPTTSKYAGSYSDAQLAAWARRIDGWRSTLKAVYVYFDNDDSAYAVDNALTLRKLTRSRAARAPRAAAREELRSR